MKKYVSLFLLFFLLAGSVVLLETYRSTEEKPYSEEMRRASDKTALAFQVVKKEREDRGIERNKTEDPGETGLIGENYTEITTTLGNPEAKRSACNPNAAALYIEMFHQLGLNPGDQVAVNLSGSFPALNLALLCALDTYGLKGTVIHSVGASSFGANLPEFTYLDMEYALWQKGYLENHTVYFSLGGQEDLGLEMPENIREEIICRLTDYGYEYIGKENWSENMEFRRQLYFQDDRPACLINVGGNLVSFGKGSQMSSADGGILTTLPSGEAGDGLIPLFLREELPVLHLLNIRDLFPEYGLPVDPLPLPAPGEGDIYLYRPYSKTLAALLFIINAGAFFFLTRAWEKKPLR